LSSLVKQGSPDKILIVIKSKELDHIVIGLIQALQSNELGIDTAVLFTMDAVEAVVRDRFPRLKTSKSIVGSGFKRYINNVIVGGYDNLLQAVRDRGIPILVDDTSLALAGLTKTDLIDGVKPVGPTTISILSSQRRVYTI